LIFIEITLKILIGITSTIVLHPSKWVRSQIVALSISGGIWFEHFSHFLFGLSNELSWSIPTTFFISAMLKEKIVEWDHTTKTLA
jgi:hypothetical protein